MKLRGFLARPLAAHAIGLRSIPTVTLCKPLQRIPPHLPATRSTRGRVSTVTGCFTAASSLANLSQRRVCLEEEGKGA
jgi:hypothetical protein